jgi:putative peptidoglycan lipid II flippase
MLISVASIAVNFAVASVMVGAAGMGHAGLALSTSSVALFAAVALLAALRRRIGRVNGRALLSSFWRVAAASAVMGLACSLSSHALHRLLRSGKAAYLADVAVSIPVGVLVFYAAARALGARELDAARAALAGPLARRFRKQRDTLR